MIDIVDQAASVHWLSLSVIGTTLPVCAVVSLETPRCSPEYHSVCARSAIVEYAKDMSFIFDHHNLLRRLFADDIAAAVHVVMTQTSGALCHWCCGLVGCEEAPA